jgi:hypothetical protein
MQEHLSAIPRRHIDVAPKIIGVDEYDYTPHIIGYHAHSSRA